MLEPAGPVHASRHAVRRRAVGGGLGAERVEERGELGQLAPVLAAQRAGGVEVAARERGRQRLGAASRNAPKPTISRRASGARASTSGHAASSSSTPLDAISLPTKSTIRSRAGSSSPSAAAASPADRSATNGRERPPPGFGRATGGRGAGVLGGGLARRRLRDAQALCRRRRVRRARREAADVDARRARAASCPPGPARPARPTGSPPCGASRRARRARCARPSRAAGRKRGYGLTVYSSALPWILTAYGTPVPASARARISGPMTRWFASATSGRARATTSRTAATLRST